MNGDLRVRQARFLRELGRAGDDGVRTTAAISSDDDAALRDLADRGLIAAAPEGRWVAGPAGSLLREDVVRAHRRRHRYGRLLELRADVDSTNDVALQRAGEGAGFAVAAELQVRGRGRRGRTFDSPPGLGLWSSTCLDPPREAARAPRLSLVVALAAADAVDRATGARCALKWPNDVRLSGRKVAGVLVEARTAGEALGPVAGIGINVHQRREEFPDEIRALAGSLEGCTGARPDRSLLLAFLLDSLEERVEAERRGTLDLVAEFAARDDLLGRDVEVPELGVRGTASGIDEEGRLLLEERSGVLHRVQSGDASVRAT